MRLPDKGYSRHFKFLNATSFPLPPLPEQRRIVSKIESLTARSRRAKEALDAIPKLLEQFRQSVLASAFRGDLTAEWRAKNPEVEPAEVLLKRIRIERRKRWEEAELAKMRAKGKAPGDDRWKAKYEEPEAIDTSELPELPDGWGWASVGECTEVSTGRLDANAAVENGSYPFFTCGDAPQRIDKYEFDTAAVLFAGNGGFNVKHYTGKFNAYQRTYVIEPVGFHVEFLYWAINRFIKTITGQNRGSTVRYIRLGDITNCPIPVPPLAEQEALIEVMRLHENSMQSIKAALEDVSIQQGTLNRSILSKAFRG